jgi:4-hydroxybutyrate dehydrogenase/sulfolactaldehyde 3-reductase
MSGTDSGTIGFIGLGAMGQPMASNLAKKGFGLVVYDIAQDRVPPLRELGADVAGSVAEVAERADIAITMVPDSPQVEATVLGPGGLLEAGRPGQLIMDMSTIDPAVTDRVAAAVADAGRSFVDAPVGRLAAHAIAGESLFMVGAHDADFERVKPLLEGMGTTIHHCGPPGSGIRTKVVNNFLIMGINQMNAEALALGQAFGLDLRKTLDVLLGTTAANGQLQLNWPNKVLKGDLEPGFRLTLAHKDVSLALESARREGVPVFAGAAVREALAMAAHDFGERDFSTILDAVCGLGGVTPPRLPDA